MELQSPEGFDKFFKLFKEQFYPNQDFVDEQSLNLFKFVWLNALSHNTTALREERELSDRLAKDLKMIHNTWIGFFGEAKGGGYGAMERANKKNKGHLIEAIYELGKDMHDTEPALQAHRERRGKG